jgi:hypothetical protein
MWFGPSDKAVKQDKPGVQQIKGRIPIPFVALLLLIVAKIVLLQAPLSRRFEMDCVGY